MKFDTFRETGIDFGIFQDLTQECRSFPENFRNLRLLSCLFGSHPEAGKYLIDKISPILDFLLSFSLKLFSSPGLFLLNHIPVQKFVEQSSSINQES